MKTHLKLFFNWGIAFEDAYSIEEKSERKVQYADSREVESAVLERFPPKPIHNYYRYATAVNLDCMAIQFQLKTVLYNRLKARLKKRGVISRKYIAEHLSLIHI